MNRHLQQYLANRLTPSGLRKLRAQIDSMDDDALAREMRADWESFDNPGSSLPAVMTPAHQPVWRRMLRYAAMLLIPLLVASTIYLYHDNRRLAAQDVTVVTGGGERASVQLPDGSVVALNSNSSLTYSASGFASSRRSVSFDGEGFFNVMKDGAHPFEVHAGSLLVTVRGTDFNLCARKDSDRASLYLETGAVELKSLGSGECVNVSPGELAVLDCVTGRFTLTGKNGGDACTAWRAGDLVYINEPLSKVIESLERNFNYTIVLEDSSLADAPFTGTLSATNIYDAITIIEMTFGLRCSGSDKVLRLSR